MPTYSLLLLHHFRRRAYRDLKATEVGWLVGHYVPLRFYPISRDAEAVFAASCIILLVQPERNNISMVLPSSTVCHRVRGANNA